MDVGLKHSCVRCVRCVSGVSGVSLCCRWTLSVCFLFQSAGGGRGLAVLSVLREAFRAEPGLLGPRLRDLLVQQHPGADG